MSPGDVAHAVRVAGYVLGGMLAFAGLLMVGLAWLYGR